jgi:hypothetical protein
MSLTKGRVCTFQFLPGIARAAFLRSESHGTHEHISLSLFLRLPPNLEGQVPPDGTWRRGVGLCGSSQGAVLRFCMYGNEPTVYITDKTSLKLTLIYDRQSVGQSVLLSGAHLGPCDQFFFRHEISCRQLRLYIL